MNQSVPPPKPQKPEPPKPVGPNISVQGRDREFLPAALEILETPPSPLPVALMLTLCAFCAVALVWSFFGRLDVHAVAWGKIETNGRAKVIQPLKDIGIRQRSGARKKLDMRPHQAAIEPPVERRGRDE